MRTWNQTQPWHCARFTEVGKIQEGADTISGHEVQAKYRRYRKKCDDKSTEPQSFGDWEKASPNVWSRKRGKYKKRRKLVHLSPPLPLAAAPLTTGLMPQRADTFSPLNKPIQFPFILPMTSIPLNKPIQFPRILPMTPIMMPVPFIQFVPVPVPGYAPPQKQMETEMEREKRVERNTKARKKWARDHSVASQNQRAGEMNMMHSQAVISKLKLQETKRQLESARKLVSALEEHTNTVMQPTYKHEGFKDSHMN